MSKILDDDYVNSVDEYYSNKYGEVTAIQSFRSNDGKLSLRVCFERGTKLPDEGEHFKGIRIEFGEHPGFAAI